MTLSVIEQQTVSMNFHSLFILLELVNLKEDAAKSEPKAGTFKEGLSGIRVGELGSE